MHILLCALFSLIVHFFGLLALPLNVANEYQRPRWKIPLNGKVFPYMNLVLLFLIFNLYFITNLRILYIQIYCSVVQHEYLTIMNI